MSDSALPAPDTEPPGHEALERLLLGDMPTLRSGDVAQRAGMPLEEARRLWRALGFPDTGDSVAFTETDLRALTLVTKAVEHGSLDIETAIRLTRALGHTMARLADWQVSTLAAYVEDRARTTGQSRLHSALELSRTVAPAFDVLLLYAWRRHLAAAASRVETLGAAEEDLLSAVVTVGFADVVSFTRLTNGLDDDLLAELVEGFESACTDVIAELGGRAIKTLGDSVLFVADGPVAGVDIALALVERVGPAAALPDVRVGLATGSVITRLGDVFGPPVNLAYRLTTVARRNRVIADVVTSAALPEEEFDTRPLPERPLRGFGAVQPVAVRRR